MSCLKVILHTSGVRGERSCWKMTRGADTEATMSDEWTIISSPMTNESCPFWYNCVIWAKVPGAPFW